MSHRRGRHHCACLQLILHRGRDCTKAEVTPHVMRREGVLSVDRALPSRIF
jgi:hypothetical protein